MASRVDSGDQTLVASEAALKDLTSQDTARLVLFFYQLKCRVDPADPSICKDPENDEKADPLCPKLKHFCCIDQDRWLVVQSNKSFADFSGV